MSFLYPVFLSALAVLLIPVIVHLFRFRKYKTVLFTRVRFLREVDIVTQHKSQIKHLLTLAIRLMALASLVLAFAIPTCNEAPVMGTGKKAVSIFIDNSFSMDNGRDGELLFETAKEKARAIIKSYGENGIFQIRSVQTPGSHLRFVPATDALAHLDALKISSGTLKLDRLLNNIAEDLAQQPEKTAAYVISDFQVGFVGDPAVVEGLKKTSVTFVKIAAENRENISIDSAWLEQTFMMPGEKNTLRFKVSNHTGEAIEDLPVKLNTENSLMATARINVEAGKSAVSSMQFTPENKMQLPAILSIEEPGASFDNELYLNLSPNGIRQIMVKGSNPYVNAVIESQSFLRKINAGSEIVPSGNSAQVLLLVDVEDVSASQVASIKSWMMETGGTVIVIPTMQLNAGVLQEGFGLPQFSKSTEPMRVATSGFSHPFFNKIFYKVPSQIQVPEIKEYLSSKGSAGGGEPVLALENGDPLLLKFNQGRGVLYFFTTPFNTGSGNLVKSTLFLPMLTNAMLSVENQTQLYGVLGSKQVMPMRNYRGNQEKPPILKLKELSIIPELSKLPDGDGIYLGTQPEIAGNYQLFSNNGSAPGEIISLNYNRLESNPNIAVPDIMQAWTTSNNIKWLDGDKANIAFEAKQADNTQWRLFIWLAAVFFALEVVILVFWDKIAQNRIKPTMNP